MTEEGGTRSFFDHRAEVYGRVSKWASAEDLNAASDRMLRRLHGSLAVDIGAGTGIMLSRLRGFERRVALDISRAMLHEVRDSALERVVADVHHLPLCENVVDLVLCRQLLHYCDVSAAIRNISRVLKPRGWLHVVQVIELPGVPDEWDQKWAGFRNVPGRQHLRRATLERAFRENSLQTIEENRLVLRDQYSWPDFFLKNGIDRSRELEVLGFFREADPRIAKAIDLHLDDAGIAYNRLFALLLLRPELSPVAAVPLHSN